MGMTFVIICIEVCLAMTNVLNAPCSSVAVAANALWPRNMLNVGSVHLLM